MIRTRRATIQDLPSLVDINKSDIAEWHHFDRHGRGAKAAYKELTEWERTMHGGPWMSLQPLRRYWPFAQKCGIICLVAEMDNRVVGHLDVIPTRERELGEYLYLDVFMVHRLFRRRGVGTELLKASESLAVEKGLPKMIVLADYEGPGGLTYRKFGFKAFLEMCTFEAKINNVVMPSGVKMVNPPFEPPLDSHHLLCGWWNTPVKLWKNCFRFEPRYLRMNPFDWCKLALSLITESGILHITLSNKECFPKMETFDVYIWSPPDVEIADLSKALQTIKAIARTIGAKTLTTLAFEKDRKVLEAAGFTWIKRHDPLLSKELSTI